jgi:alcohol dehydrogenase class IV
MSKETNAQVRYFSSIAYSLIISNMIPILKGKGDLQHWQNMQWAAVYAMFALSNSTSGPTGALSYYLGTHYRVNHGVAGGVFIGKICEFNHDHGFFDLSELYNGENKNELDKEEKSAQIIKEIYQLLELANIPRKLTGLGVKQSELDNFNSFAAQAKIAMDYNPIEIDPTRVAELFIQI